MGFAGAVSSGLVMAALVRWLPLKTMIPASICGAITHSTAQILVAISYLHHPGLWSYWVVLTGASCATGVLVGLAADRTLFLARRWTGGVKA
jgi:uncharacterized membrane protein